MAVIRIIEGDKSYLTEEESKVINESLQAIEENIEKLVFNAQVIKDGFVTDWRPFTLSKENVESIMVDLDCNYDEFYINVKEPVIMQYIDGEPKYDKSIYLEVVTEEVAISNDEDFLEDFDEATYKVGEGDSYYLYVGEVEGTKYYYREL